jgi:hypothetical protein
MMLPTPSYIPSGDGVWEAIGSGTIGPTTPLPTCADGDIIVIAWARSPGGGNTLTITAPDGWTALWHSSYIVSNASFYGGFIWKAMTAADSGTLIPTSTMISGSISRYVHFRCTRRAPAPIAGNIGGIVEMGLFQNQTIAAGALLKKPPLFLYLHTVHNTAVTTTVPDPTFINIDGVSRPFLVAASNGPNKAYICWETGRTDIGDRVIFNQRTTVSGIIIRHRGAYIWRN